MYPIYTLYIEYIMDKMIWHSSTNCCFICEETTVYLNIQQVQ